VALVRLGLPEPVAVLVPGLMVESPGVVRLPEPGSGLVELLELVPGLAAFRHPASVVVPELPELLGRQVVRAVHQLELVVPVAPVVPVGQVAGSFVRRLWVSFYFE
jgi:hypothetical protein